MDEGKTQVVTFARNADFTLENRIHCLELIEGSDSGRRFTIGASGMSIGRVLPAGIVLADSEVSRIHCQLALENEVLTVTDLNSTNGTFVDGVRIHAPTAVPVGAMLRVGRQTLKHEWRTQFEILQQDEFDRDIRRARSYVEGLLPPLMSEGPIRTDWLYKPCSKLGGDAFGYVAISDTRFLIYMMDVSGHGAGAAMHSATVMNLLKQRALPNADIGEPAQVLTALNRMFPMEEHAGMYFSMWLGVYDSTSRELVFASAGHHPGFLVLPDRNQPIGLRTRCGLIGADAGTRFTGSRATIPAGASLYLFSDGVFEIVTKEGIEWRLDDFLPYLMRPPIPGLPESRRLYTEVRSLSQPGPLEDDFTLLAVTFD